MDWEKLATNFGLPGLMLVVFGYVALTLGKLWISSAERTKVEEIKVEDKKAEAMTSALTSLSGKIDSHHTTDIQSHQSLAVGIGEIKGKLDEAINWQDRTPIEGVPRPTGLYGVRAKTSPGGVK